MGFRSLLTLALPTASSATLMYVTSYAGTLTTLNLTTPTVDDSSGKASLAQVSVTEGCAGNTSWLTLDAANGILYCLDEAFASPNGTLVAFRTSDNGTLTQLGKVPTLGGPVSAVLYGNNATGLAVAEYGGSGFQTFAVADPSNIAQLNQVVFTLDEPGAVPDRQEAPHPHQASLDPTGQYVVVPDLGADLVRVFTVDSQTLEWTASTPLTVPAGSGPRHASWLVTTTKTFMFLVSELANTVTSYQVVYGDHALDFVQVYASSTHGLNATVPAGASAAEVVVTPDNRFLILSSRGEGALTIPNFDPGNATEIVSDPLITFSIDLATGTLAHVQTFAAGGRTPRHFSINKAGTLLGVGLQGDERTVVIRRDPASGLLQDFAASIPIAGEVTSVVFDE